jgi:hypothetical protein
MSTISGLGLKGFLVDSMAYLLGTLILTFSTGRDYAFHLVHHSAS